MSLSISRPNIRLASYFFEIYFLEATIVALLANIVRNAPFLTIIVDGMQTHGIRGIYENMLLLKGLDGQISSN